MHSTEVTAANIPQRRIGQRFDLAEVDAFLAECADALRAYEQRRIPALRTSDIVVKRFRSVPFFGVGYDADAVDDLLDRVAMQLRVHEPDSAEEDAQEAELRATLARLQEDLRGRRR